MKNVLLKVGLSEIPFPEFLGMGFTIEDFPFLGTFWNSAGIRFQFLANSQVNFLLDLHLLIQDFLDFLQDDRRLTLQCGITMLLKKLENRMGKVGLLIVT